MDMNAVIAEATEVATKAEASKVEVKPEPEAKIDVKSDDLDKAQEARTEEDKAKELAKKPDSELTQEQLAKREANRQSHLNSKLARMRRENRELQEKLAAQQKAAPPAQSNTSGAPQKPSEDKFNTWGEYQDALGKYYEDLADWKVEQKLAERETKTNEDTQTNHIAAQKLQRIQEIAAQEQEFAKSTPEYTALYNEYSDFMNNLPQHVGEALLEADNATLALYALMKEGKLESLEDMSPYKLAMEIGKAELRGEGYLVKPNKTTNTPPPIEAGRGAASTTKSLSDKSVEELLKQFNTR